MAEKEIETDLEAGFCRSGRAIRKNSSPAAKQLIEEEVSETPEVSKPSGAYLFKRAAGGLLTRVSPRELPVNTRGNARAGGGGKCRARINARLGIIRFAIQTLLCLGIIGLSVRQKESPGPSARLCPSFSHVPLLCLYIIIYKHIYFKALIKIRPIL
ncbi:MAG: hypothetical protein ACYDIC_11365 [Desulfobaccales bacterium]